MRVFAITFAIVLARSVASAAECPATAVLEGDGALIDSIDAQLVRRGVATSATANCPVAKARIERRASGVTVIVTDPNGRRSERTLADPDAAAALIESWARQDMNAAALLGWTEPAPIVIEPPQIVVKEPAPPVRDTRDSDRMMVVAAGETSFAFDGSSWLGGRASACVRIGPACAGATARMLVDDPRTSLDVLGGVDVPYSFTRRVAILLGAGLGGGWFKSQYTSGEAVLTSVTAGLRIDGHLSLSISVARHVSLHAGISLGASPQAPVTLTTGDMPMTNGEPTGFFRGDVGLRIGAP